VASLSDTRRTMSIVSRIAGLLPAMPSAGSLTPTTARRWRSSRSSSRWASARPIATASVSSLIGFRMKSYAPARIAPIAFSSVLCPVITIDSTSG
jgi:hypothetical protein